MKHTRVGLFSLVLTLGWSSAGLAQAPGGAAEPVDPEEVAALEERMDLLVRRLDSLETLEPAEIEVEHVYVFTLPSREISTPNAYGGRLGNIGVGVGFQERKRYTPAVFGGTRQDFVLGIGAGLGDPDRWVGLAVDLTVLDASHFSTGWVSVKVNRKIARKLSVAVGVENLAHWGTPDAPRSYYGVASKRFDLRPNSRAVFSRLFASAGVGSGRFRTEADFREEEETLGLFGALALQIIEQANVFAEWSGQDLFLGGAISPFSRWSPVVTLAFADVTGSAGDGARFIVGVGLAVPLRH